MHRKKIQMKFRYKVGGLLFASVVIVSCIAAIVELIVIQNNLKIDFNQEQSMIEQRLLNNLSNMDYINYLIEKPMEAEAEEILGKVKKEYETMDDIGFSLEAFLTGKDNIDLYIISSDNIIVAATDRNDIGLNFNNNSSFTAFLEDIRTGGSFTAARINLSVLEGNMTKYCYLPSSDGRYIFEYGAPLVQDDAFTGSVGFDNFYEQIQADNTDIDRILLYNYQRISYKKLRDGKNAVIQESQKTYFDQAVKTMQTVYAVTKIDGSELYYQYIPYRIIGSKGSNEINVIEVIYNKNRFTRTLDGYVIRVILINLSGALIAGFFGIYLTRKMTSPIEVLAEGAERIGEGDFDYKIRVKSHDEFSTLSNQFSNMQEKIKTLLSERYEAEKDLENKNKEISEHKDEIESLYEETVSINEELETLFVKNKNSYFETVKVLANVIEEKDQYTGGHCERVMIYSMMMGEALGLGEQEKNDLQFGSILHDIGKIGVPEYILHKKDKLTAEEYDNIKKHPEIGYQLLSNLDFLDSSRRIVYEHHERVDGKGYPRGLKDNEIHLLAKIVCVADAFDAMTSNRVYRKVMTLDEAFMELIACKGTQFDAEIVDAFVRYFQSEDNRNKLPGDIKLS